jgi:hypothetical protein
MIDGKFVVESPDAVKAIKLSGPKEKKLSDYALYKLDFEFAAKALILIKSTQDEFLIETLWRSAVVHYCKCFDHDSRSKLCERKVYKNQDQLCLKSFKHMMMLRDKHIVHDVNRLSTSIPIAVLNNDTSPLKVADVQCLTLEAVTMNEGHLANLALLIHLATHWINLEMDRLTIEISKELETLEYQQLFNMPEATYEVPLDLWEEKPKGWKPPADH